MITIGLDGAGGYQVTDAMFVYGEDTGHPCGECTLCRTPIEEGTRYTTWELTIPAPNRRSVLEHICMECHWVLRNNIASGRVRYLNPMVPQ